jgi:PKD repeat protein
MTIWEPAAGADFDWSPMTGTVGSAVYFTATLAAGTGDLVYTWDFGDGMGDVGMEVSHAFATADDFDVELTVSNACAAPTAMHTVTVVEVTPAMGRYYLPIIVKNY